MEELVAMSFWQGKKVFLTGHTGFKGAWLSKMLLRQGANVFGFSLNPPTEPSLYSQSKELKSLPQKIGDIRSGLILQQSLLEFKPEIVFHLAAQSLVRDSYHDPVLTFETNVMGTVNLFEAVRTSSSVRSIVNVTSDKCYDNKEWLWGYRENEPMGGKDPYSASKGCAELVTSSYRQSFFSSTDIRLASARAGNVFGGGDWARDRLIPDLVRAFSSNKLAEIRSPNSVRPWQFVLEPLSGYMTLAEKNYTDLGYAEGWNFGPHELDAKPVSWIVDSLIRNWGEGAKYKIVEAEKALKEASLLKLDSSKSRNRLNWSSALDLETSLQWTVDFYKAFYKGEKLDFWTDLQIENYLAKKKVSYDKLSIL